MTKLCDSCEYLKFCARSGIEDVGCDRYKKDTTTNEDWFCSLPTEEKAEFLVMIQMSVMHPVKRGAVDMDKFIEEVVDWLKQPHIKE